MATVHFWFALSTRLGCRVLRSKQHPTSLGWQLSVVSTLTAQSNSSGKLCGICNERPAVSGALRWYAFAPFFLLEGIGVLQPYCEDCAGGKNLLGAIVMIGVVLFAFVLAVIFW